MIFVKKAVSILALLALAACSGMMGGGSTVNVNLSGAQEVPPVATQASGSGSFTIAQDGRGQNGPVAVPLSKGADGSWSPAPGAKLSEAQMSAFKAGNLYVNVHSPSNKGGEIRDQLTP